MGDVIDFKPRPDGLLGLPECPIKACAKCGRTMAETTWIDIRLGCGVCAPDLERVSLEMAGMSSRVFLLEEAMRQIVRKAGKFGSVGPNVIRRVLDDLKLDIPPGDGE